MTVRKYIALIVLIGFSELVSCEVCKLHFEKKKESKWTKFQIGVVNSLKLDVTYDCENFDCKPLKDADVQIDKSNKTGCRCSKDVKDGSLQAYDCRCCFKIKKWNFLICIASAVEVFDPFKFSIFVTLDGTVFARFNFPLKSLADKYIPLCVPALLPPPLHWLSPCFKFKFEVPNDKNNFTWRVCGKIKLGIFIVPVLTIYTKCFVITQEVNLMTMEGTLFDDEVETPATVKVKDENNLEACMCLSNKKKADAIASKSNRDVAGNRIVMDEKINWQETKFEKNPFLVLLHTDNYLLPVQDLHDDDAYAGLQELVKEAEENQWMTATPPEYDFPGGSCGGALLSADKVLTICACVRSFYAAHKLKKNFNNDEEEVFKFDITSPQIRLKFADPSLASGSYFLDTDDTKMMADSECSKNINKSASPDIMKTSMIVMPFTPAIANPNDIFVSWPPGAFPSQTVSMVAYGMQAKNMDWDFKDSSGNVIHFPSTAVEFYLKNCDNTDYCTTELGNGQPISGPVKDRTKCVCAENPGFQLFGGEIGFPLTSDRKLYGLTSLPVDNGTEGSTVGTVFDATAIQEIEKYVGKGNLHAWTGKPGDATTAVRTSYPANPNPTTTKPKPKKPTKPSNSVVGAIRRSPPSLLQFLSFIAMISY